MLRGPVARIELEGFLELGFRLRLFAGLLESPALRIRAGALFLSELAESMAIFEACFADEALPCSSASRTICGVRTAGNTCGGRDESNG